MREMDVNRFSAADWEWIQRALADDPSFDLAGFRDWLTWPETEARLDERFGAEWSLPQALELVHEPPSVTPPREDGFKQRRRAAARSRGQGLRPVQEKEPSAENELEPEPTDPQADAELERKVRARVDEYLARFTDVTPNDLASIRDLAYAEITTESLNQALSRELAKGQPDQGRISRFTYSLKGLSEQTRSLQRMLGIDRATREKQARRRSDVDEVLDVIRSAGEWLEQQSFRLEHCGVLYGFLVTEFREAPASVTYQCSVCHQAVTVEHVPAAEDLRALEPEWVAQEEGQYQDVAANGRREQLLDEIVQEEE